MFFLSLFSILLAFIYGFEETCIKNNDLFYYSEATTVDMIINRAGSNASLHCRERLQREINEYEYNLETCNKKNPDEHLKFSTQCPTQNDTLFTHNISTAGGISYIVLAHKLGMLQRIINILNDSFVIFVIHVDVRSPVLQGAIQYLYRGETNVYLLPSQLRQTITWGGFSIVNATIQAYKFALSLRNHAFDWIIDISESHYPLQSSSHIWQHLIQSKQLAFAHINRKPFKPRAFYHFVECEGSLYLLRPKSVDLGGMEQYVGSQFKILHRQIAIWLTSDALPIKYIDYAKNVIIADENFFATLLLNSPFCHMIETSFNRLFIIFEPFDHLTPVALNKKKCLVPGAICGRSPKILELNSTSGSLLTRILNRNDERYFFARKFDPAFPNSLLLADFIDHERHRSIK